MMTIQSMDVYMYPFGLGCQAFVDEIQLGPWGAGHASLNLLPPYPALQSEEKLVTITCVYRDLARD